MRNLPFNKLQSYILATALVIALILGGLLTPMTASAANLDNGTWVNMPRYLNFGQYNGHNLRWRVLEITDSHAANPGNKTALLLLDDLLRKPNGDVELRPFNGANGSWQGSAIRSFLGSASFYGNAFSSSQQNAILPYSWSALDSGVFLLSSEEARNPSYFADDADRQIGNQVWWLRTKEPDIYSFYPVAVVIQSGSTDSYAITHTGVAVRPAIRVNLSSAYFDAEGGSGPYLSTGFGSNPPTGISDITGSAAAMFAFIVLSAALWGYIIFSRRKRNG